MANITLYVPDDLKEMMDEHKEVRWSNVVRIVIERKLREFEEAEKIARKSRLTQEDVDRISAKIDKAAARRARELLDEIGN